MIEGRDQANLNEAVDRVVIAHQKWRDAHDELKKAREAVTAVVQGIVDNATLPVVKGVGA